MIINVSVFPTVLFVKLKNYQNVLIKDLI